MDATRFEQALTELTGTMSARRKDFTEPVVALHQRLLRHFADTGAAPTTDIVRAWAGELDIDPAEALDQLTRADLIEADPPSARVVGVYPFIDGSRGHQVHIADGPTAQAYCAVDALGVPPMLGRPATITSRDPHSGDEIRVTVDGGHTSWEPPQAVVSTPAWAVEHATAPAGDIEHNPSAGDTLCPTVNFFADTESAAAYQQAHRLDLEILTIPQALRAAQAVFGDLLEKRKIGTDATTTVNLHDLTLDELTDHLAARFKQILPTEEYRRLLVPMLRELATGQPVEPERLAALAEVPLEQTLDMLRQAPTEWDPSGKRLVGFGLTSNPTPHRFEIHGHTLWAWCAVDAVLFPVMIGAPARIESPCAATGDPIVIDLTPTDVQRVEPDSAVVSIVAPPVGIAEVRQAVCAPTNFYRSAEAAAPWQAEHPEALLLPVVDTFELYRRAAAHVWGAELLG